VSPCSPGQKPPSCSENRGYVRRDVLVAGRLECGGIWTACEVLNVSAGGARLRVPIPYGLGERLCLDIESCGRFAAVVAWARGDEVGLKFSCDPAQTAEALIALATYG